VKIGLVFGFLNDIIIQNFQLCLASLPKHLWANHGFQTKLPNLLSTRIAVS